MIEIVESYWPFIIVISWYGYEKYKLIFNKNGVQNKK